MGQVTVRSKFGQLGTMDEAQLPKALKHGFSLATNDEIKEHNDQIEYGEGLINPALAFAEEAASTATFGLSRQAENLSGLTTPEEQAGRAKYNPVSGLLGIPAGLVIDPLGAVSKVSKLGTRTGEIAAKAIGKAPEGAGLLARASKNIPAAAAQFAAEGAIYGAGQGVAEHALGDPDLNAEKIVSNIGYGSLIAGGLGGLLEGGANVFGKSTLKVPKGLADAAKADSFQADIAQGVANQEAVEHSGLATEAPLGVEPQAQPQTPFKDFPKSLEEIKSSVKSNFPIIPEELPSGGRLKEAVNELPDLQFKPHNLQYESLKDQGLRDYYKTFLESQGEDAETLRRYESAQKAEAVQKLENTIQSVAPGKSLETDPIKAGSSAIKSFVDQYQAEKEALTPVFKQFDKIAENKKINPVDGLLKLHDIFPKIGEYLNADGEGVFRLKKYSPSMPFSKNTYQAIKDLVQVSNEEGLTLAKLRAVRESMRDRLTLNSAARDYAQIGAIRKALMDEMEAHVSKLAPNMEVRETFRRFAKNEAEREVIEKIMGGSVSERANFAKKIKPEDVLDKIFSNTVSTKAAKEVLGEEFKKVLADYLNQKKLSLTDKAKNGFSSNRFATFLKTKGPELAEAMSGEAGVNPNLRRLNNLTDYMRILPDSPSVNPSGTAKTLNILEKMAGLSRSLRPTHLIEDMAERIANKETQAQQRYTIGEVLAGKNLASAKEAADNHYLATSSLAKIGRYAEETAYAIKENAKAIFDTGVSLSKKAVGITGSKLVPSPKKKLEKNKDDEASIGKHHDVFARINELQNNPERMAEDLQQAVASVYEHAPNIAQAIQVTAAKATQLLASKLPPRMPVSPFVHERYEPSKSELADFERTYNVIEDPLRVMSSVKDKSVSPDDVLALSVVYPKLYQEMQMAVIDEASKLASKKKPIPYSTRQAISIFMQAPADEGFSTMAIQANQQAFQQVNPQLQQQAKPSKAGMMDMTIANRTGLNHGSNLDT